MDILERFLKYVKYDTQSDEYSSSTPSSLKQLILANELVNDLKEIGILNAFCDEYGVVYGHLEGNCPSSLSIGLIAHMDTSPDCSGQNVNPRVIKNYDGSDIKLNDNLTMKTSDFPSLLENIHEDLVVTDGNTLLGSDDKAGICIIFETIKKLINDTNIKHGDIYIAITPDEEVGRGTENFNYDYFKCDFAYTLDGGNIHEIEIENFNAYTVSVDIKGVSIHPGSAKNKMINSILLGMEFDSMLPKNEIPSKTDGYQCFHHLCDIKGDIENTKMSYILRSFDLVEIQRQIDDFITIQKYINNKYGGEYVSVSYFSSYFNMKEIIDKHPHVVERITSAYKLSTIDYKFSPIRGGTDGASLSYNGIPTPNLGTGGYNFHGKYEYLSVTQMRQMVEILIKILKN